MLLESALQGLDSAFVTLEFEYLIVFVLHLFLETFYFYLELLVEYFCLPACLSLFLIDHDALPVLLISSGHSEFTSDLLVHECFDLLLNGVNTVKRVILLHILEDIRLLFLRLLGVYVLVDLFLLELDVVVLLLDLLDETV